MNVLRFWNILSSGIMLLGAFLFGYQIWEYETFTFLSSIGVLIFIIGIIISIIKIKCPFCHHFLGILGPVGKFCPFCGEQIRK